MKLINQPLLAVLFAVLSCGGRIFADESPASNTGDSPHPPIPIKFSLDEPSYVTLVIDDAKGKRVRNIVSETSFPAGENTVWWDGLDESGKADISQRGYYRITGKLVDPGTYHVRGLIRKQLDLSYEFTPYNPGNPPWPVYGATSSGWLADHTAPSDALFVPGSDPRVLIGSYTAEGGSSLVWLDLNGHKTRGMSWLGGGEWTGASHLARDVGSRPLPDIQGYAATSVYIAATSGVPAHQELRIITIWDANFAEQFGKGIKPALLVYSYPALPEDHIYQTTLGGLAVRDGLILVTIPSRNQILFIDATAGKILKTYTLPDPRGIAFDADGQLLLLSGTQLQRLKVPLTPDDVVATAELPAPEVLASKGLDDPQRLTLDPDGNIYVSDQGLSHNVKVFSSDGKFLHAIGKPGVPKTGPYDEQRMNHPTGLTITNDGHLWVAERDEAPRRVSIWNLDGTFVRAFYGGPRYGGGGIIDPKDKTRYYYGYNEYGMEFHLDWDHGTSQLVDVYDRPASDMIGDDGMPKTKFGSDGAPETPIYAFGKQYMTDCNNVWLMGANIARLWVMRDGVAVPVAMAGRAMDWPGFKEEPFKSLLPKRKPEDSDDAYRYRLSALLFAWSDRNGDGKVEPEELTFKQAPVELECWITSTTVQPDLSMLTGSGYRLTPTSVTDAGVPLYDMATSVPVFDPVLNRTNRTQANDMGDDWIVQLGGPICGYRKGQLTWTYPCRWPGLDPMYYDPLEEWGPGKIIGLTRYVGPPIVPAGPEVGPIWAANANNGTVNLMTSDGLFVGTLGQDNRIGQRIQKTPDATRGLSMTKLTFGEEHFFVNFCPTSDGKYYICCAFGIIRVDGLDTIKRLPDQTLDITKPMLTDAAAYVLSSDSQPAQPQSTDPLVVSILREPPVVDGKIRDWDGIQWATIHPSSRPKSEEGLMQAAIAISGKTLYALYKTDDPHLLSSNSGESIEGLFKTGGALDLMLGTDPNANSKRITPAAGDIRLLVTQVKGKTMATLYRAVVPGTKTPVPFSSPWRTITLDRVDDVSSQVQLNINPSTPPSQMTQYAFSIPLYVLGIDPSSDQDLLGDVGILRGNAGATVERLYWHNKASGLTADVPGEAMLTPQMWGALKMGVPVDKTQ